MNLFVLIELFKSFDYWSYTISIRWSLILSLLQTSLWKDFFSIKDNLVNTSGFKIKPRKINIPSCYILDGQHTKKNFILSSSDGLSKTSWPLGQKAGRGSASSRENSIQIFVLQLSKVKIQTFSSDGGLWIFNI